MTKNTRSRNLYFNRTDVFSYLKEYVGSIAYGLNRIDHVQLVAAMAAIADCHHIMRAAVYVGGNGGSAAIADHLLCDFTKGTCIENKQGIRVINLGGSPALLTAIANDLGYQHTLSFPLQTFEINPQDVVILISSSGNSPNIIEAATLTKKRGSKLIGLTGFDGGELRKMADISLHVPVNNYGVIEDCHQAIMHTMAQFHYLSLNE